MKTKDPQSWPDFFENFYYHHAGFIRELISNYPHITPREFELCCYLRAGYHNRDIAERCGCTLRSVETLRYRLRKKLPLATHDDLSMFLMQI